MIAAGTCFEMEYEKQAAFRGCYGVGGGKCGAFTCPCVGRTSIRPTNDPPKGGEGPAFGRVQAFAIHGMALCGAYAIRPYHVTRKMITVGACFAVGYEKRGAMPAFYRLTWHRSYACDLFYLGRLGVSALVALIV